MVYLSLAMVAVLTGSSGPTWFKLMGSDPGPFVKVHWRMTLTALIQAPLAFFQLYNLEREKRKTVLSQLPRLVFPVGVCLSLHFACVVYSVSTTSFAHAIATINTAPLFFTAFFLLRHLASLFSQRYMASGLIGVKGSGGEALSSPTFLDPSRSPPPSLLEGSGALLAFCGVCALVSLDSASSDLPVTLGGDVVGCMASLFMALYLYGGRRRGDTPLFAWMFPLHVCASAISGALALVTGGSVGGGDGLLGWTVSQNAFGATLGSAVVPSLVAHSLINFLTTPGILSPFIVAMILNLQPISGNVIAWAVGLQGQPSLLSLCFVPLIVLGLLLSTWGKQSVGSK